MVGSKAFYFKWMPSLIRDKGSSDEVFLIRDNGIIPFKDIVNDEESKNE